MNPDDAERRGFLRRIAQGAAGLLGGSLAEGIAEARRRPDRQPVSYKAPGEIPRRPFGSTGVQVSALGVGGHHLGEAASVGEAERIVHEAIDAGIDFFDNCWEYHNGQSENWLGRALRRKRDRVFLMTKVCTHGRPGALGLRMLEESLRRLGTDHLDLWQIHAVSFDNDPMLARAAGGILEAMDRAKREGKVRFVGFTGHKDPAIHLAMLQTDYPFDAVQMPLNPFDHHFLSFERQVLPEVNRRGMAALGMKSMGGRGDAIKAGVLTAEEALRYAMSLPVAVTISGMSDVDMLRRNIALARSLTPLGGKELDALRARCAAVAADGRYEHYKVSLEFDNPEARAPHGFPLDGRMREVHEQLDGAMAPPSTLEFSGAPLQEKK